MTVTRITINVYLSEDFIYFTLNNMIFQKVLYLTFEIMFLSLYWYKWGLGLCICNIFSSILDLHSLDASSTHIHIHIHDNKKCLQILPSVPWRAVSPLPPPPLTITDLKPMFISLTTSVDKNLIHPNKIQAFPLKNSV